MFIRVMAATGGVKDEFVDLMLDDYREELFQLKYNSKYVTARDRKMMEATRKKISDADVLKRVAAFSSETPKDPKKKKKRK